MFKSANKKDQVPHVSPFFKAFSTACLFIPNIEWTNNNGIYMQFG